MVDEIDEKKTPKLRSLTNESLDDLKERLELVKHIDDVENDLESCCSSRKTDKRLVILSGQLMVSFFVIFFIFYKLSNDDDDNSNSKIYMPLLSSVISYWFGRSSNKSET